MNWRKSLLCTEVPLLFHGCPATPLSNTTEILFQSVHKMQKEAVCLGRAAIYTSLCSSWACRLWRRTCSAPECPPSGLLLSHLAENTLLSPPGHDPRAVCLLCAAALAPPVSGSSPHYPSVEPVVHNDPYQHRITVVKVSINRISSCPSLLAGSAVLFLTEKHVDTKQKYFFFKSLY